MNKLGKVLLGGAIITGAGVLVVKVIKSKKKEKETTDSLDQEIKDAKQTSMNIDDMIEGMKKSNDELENLRKIRDENSSVLDDLIRQAEDMVKDLEDQGIIDRRREALNKTNKKVTDSIDERLKNHNMKIVK